MREYGGFYRNSGDAITSDSAQLQPSLAHQAELPESYYNAPHVVEWYYGTHAIQLANFFMPNHHIRVHSNPFLQSQCKKSRRVVLSGILRVTHINDPRMFQGSVKVDAEVGSGTAETSIQN